MISDTEEVVLSPGAEAERLWQRASEAFERDRDDLISLIGAFDLGIRVVEINAVRCLQRVRNEFPATIGAMLETPPAIVDAERDFIHPPKSLRFVHVVDLLSQDRMTCVSRSLHHGWEDRRESCRRAREWARKATGFSLAEGEREDLVVLGAYRNRIFFVPPPVRVLPGDIIRAFPTLAEVVNRLFSAISAHAA